MSKLADNFKYCLFITDDEKKGQRIYWLNTISDFFEMLDKLQKELKREPIHHKDYDYAFFI